MSTERNEFTVERGFKITHLMNGALKAAMQGKKTLIVCSTLNQRDYIQQRLDELPGHLNTNLITVVAAIEVSELREREQKFEIVIDELTEIKENHWMEALRYNPLKDSKPQHQHVYDQYVPSDFEPYLRCKCGQCQVVGMFGKIKDHFHDTGEKWDWVSCPWQPETTAMIGANMAALAVAGKFVAHNAILQMSDTPYPGLRHSLGDWRGMDFGPQ